MTQPPTREAAWKLLVDYNPSDSLQRHALAVEAVMRDIRAAALSGTASLGQLEETVIDIKTIEIQLLSPNPKTEVIRQVLLSMQKNLADLGLGDQAARVKALMQS